MRVVVKSIYWAIYREVLGERPLVGRAPCNTGRSASFRARLLSQWGRGCARLSPQLCGTTRVSDLVGNLRRVQSFGSLDMWWLHVRRLLACLVLQVG